MSQEIAERPDDAELEQMSEQQLQAVIESYTLRVSQLQESLATQVQLAYDNLGWQPMGSAYNGTRNGPSLQSVKDIASVGEQVATVNPMAKRGISVRSSYIWGGDTRIRRIPKRGRDVRSVRRVLGTSRGQFELERSLAATGNLFFEVTRRRSLRMVPLVDITDAVADGDDPAVITYVQIGYDELIPTDAAAGTDSRLNTFYNTHPVREWVPTIEQSGPLHSAINGVEVNTAKRIKHVAVNRPTGWWWGIPDLYAVIMWVKAYKEYLEDNKTLTKAYAQFAWKVTSSTRRGGERVSSRMAQAPATDPLTGRAMDVGAAAVLGADQDMSPLQSLRSVDFDNGRPIAAMVAAGLEIPLQVLISDAAAGGARRTDESLDDATARAMKARQSMMNDELADVAQLLGISSFNIDWPEVSPEPTHRVVQALDMGGRSGMLYPNEWRRALGKALDLDLSGPAPDLEELPVVLRPAMQALIAPGQGAGGDEVPDAAASQIEPPSYGDHELRDEGYQDHTRAS